ncbi:hypothetical protein F4814DRAFT_15590 [Daldinia grandis]|nr:hypothetical protein F4814DRAFT_15590 [Daldinia grandis]
MRLDYCARYWPEHFLQSDARAKIESDALPLFQSITAGYFERWVQTWNYDDDDGELTGNIPSPLYYASLIGLASVVSTLLGFRGGSVKPTLTMHDVPPLKAINRAPSYVMELSKGNANVDVVGGRYGTA